MCIPGIFAPLKMPTVNIPPAPTPPRTPTPLPPITPVETGAQGALKKPKGRKLLTSIRSSVAGTGGLTGSVGLPSIGGSS